ncbi:Hypothetical_protein [Hexamita inflata]|uniref:Hypothetical_protein n=1 Tax=Hexamita inflata TaxID=28002 RepID=A0AA86UPM2_9EUKA|nr:Hypothetical protein HINF_LOCUS13216 [Hexamita inflata]CAI9966715.1 Hypothetical protein HINF_LOCUS54360 [Hexamita inflata]
MDNSVDRARQVITDYFIIDYLCTELDTELEPNRVRAHQTQEIQIRDKLLVSEMKALDDLAETMMELITHVYSSNENVDEEELEKFAKVKKFWVDIQRQYRENEYRAGCSKNQIRRQNINYQIL